MCCENPIATTSLDTGPFHACGTPSTCSGSGSENAPLVRCPGSLTLSVASPAVEVVYVRSTPGVNAPNDAAGPRVSESVAGTVPPTLPVASVVTLSGAPASGCEAESATVTVYGPRTIRQPPS